MKVKKKITFAEVRRMIIQKYADKPDSFDLSIGDWEAQDAFGLPEFRARRVCGEPRSEPGC